VVSSAKSETDLRKGESNTQLYIYWRQGVSAS